MVGLGGQGTKGEGGEGVVATSPPVEGSLVDYWLDWELKVRGVATSPPVEGSLVDYWLDWEVRELKVRGERGL